MRHRARARAARALPGQLLRRRDVVHHVRHRDHLIYPYAVNRGELGAFAFWEMLAFSVVFFGAFVYVVARGALDWGPLHRPRDSPTRRATWCRPSARRRPPSAASAPRAAPTPIRQPETGSEETMGLVRNILDDGLGGLDHNVVTRSVGGPRQVVAQPEQLGRHLRPRVLRHRDDGYRRCALRHLPLRHGGLPGLAPSGRHHDRRRSRQPEDGAGAPSGLRPDDGAQVGHLHGRVRLERRHVQQLRHRPGVDQIVPVDVYAPGCPPTPETLIHAIETLHQKIEDGEIMRRRSESGAGANLHITEIPASAAPVAVALGGRGA